MQVGKCGDSPVAHLPAEIVEALQLKEGDEVAIEVAGDHILRIERGRTREETLARLRAFARPASPGVRFSRDEANERGGG